MEIGNDRFRKLKIEENCRLIQGDCQRTLPLMDSDYDAVYAIYSLKYFSDLTPVLREIARIMKPGGLFLIYDLVKTNNYDEENPKHRYY